MPRLVSAFCFLALVLGSLISTIAPVAALPSAEVPSIHARAKCANLRVRKEWYVSGFVSLKVLDRANLILAGVI
jgi:hypothetical protein